MRDENENCKFEKELFGMAKDIADIKAIYSLQSKDIADIKNIQMQQVKDIAAMSAMQSSQMSVIADHSARGDNIQKIVIGIIFTLVLNIIGAAFYYGGLNNEVKNIRQCVERNDKSS